MRAPSLRTLQEWMSIVVRHPGTAAVALRSRPARSVLAARHVLRGEVVRPTAALDVAGRLDVYNGGYLARLVEALESDYRGVAAVLGHGGFHRLVARYVAHHPSRHPNLNRFGKELPEFVRDHLHDRRAPFLAELARLERAMTLAFDAPEFTPLGEAALAALTPEELAEARLVPNPSLHLLSTRWPVDPFLVEILENDQVPALPRRRTCELAVFRSAGRVWRTALDTSEARVLRLLLAGKPLGKSLSGVRASSEAVGTWFRRWSTEGFFVAVTR